MKHAETLVSYLGYSSTLKMERICSWETSVGFNRATWPHISKDKKKGFFSTI
jgi:hypothetical protein